MARTFSLSANIENGFAEGMQYLVTPNAKNAIHNIVNDFHSGIHSFTIIGSYGTGKSSFLLALEADLKKTGKKRCLLDSKNLSDAKAFEIMNIVGDYAEMSTLLSRALNIEGNTDSILDSLKDYYNQCQKKGKFLLIVIDEFGKVLEHAAKNNPEKELYFLQKLSELINVPTRQIMLLTTLHQNFGAYAKGLTKEQTNEWTKVKGRFKEITFVEPIEQLLHLASIQLQEQQSHKATDNILKLAELAKSTRFVSQDFSVDTAMQLYPLDLFSAYTITSAIRRYGQNERSLFTFLAAKGSNSISEFEADDHLTYNLQNVYDYILYNFYSYLKDANADSMSWGAIKVSIERVEGQDWSDKNEMLNATKLVKAIGLLNLFGTAGFKLTERNLTDYAREAMAMDNAKEIIQKLSAKKIIRYAAYKERLVLFEGTDIDLEAEIIEAGMKVSRPDSIVDELSVFFNRRISPVKAHFYQKGTPRFFDYLIREEPLDVVPTGDTDGYIELIFSTNKKVLAQIKDFSSENEHALIFAYFTNTEAIIEHLYNIKKYLYLLERVIDKSDRVAFTEIQKQKEHEENLLNKAISDNLFSYQDRVVWVFDGKVQKVASHRDFNKLLSRVCDKVYSQTPVMINELFNKHKLSGTISSARKSYLTHLIDHNSEVGLGFANDKFPPEKTIYASLLQNTGLHLDGDFADMPTNKGFMPLWNACEEFLNSSENKARKISELIKLLSAQPYKLKQGFLEFWIPTYLYIKRQDFALYNVSNGAFMPNVNMEFFDLLQKHPGDFAVKKFAVDGMKMGFFNQYRRFINLGDEHAITNSNFIETIKPFLSFYVRLNEYTKHTRKFDHESTMRFRDVLANAKDPEKAFFEDLPDALGFTQEILKQEEFINEYGRIIQRAIKELRTCYTQLIDRIEARLVEGFGLQSYEYSEYIVEVRERLANVKDYLLTGKQREFYHHVMTEYDNRTEWYQSICYTILEQRLDALRDEQEDKLADDLVYLFRECEKYSDISKKIGNTEQNEAYSFDMVTSKGSSVRTQTYVLPEKDKSKAADLEKKINQLLSGDNNVDVCTLLSILSKKMK
ncbi:ATP-binding protein [Prevotella sp. P6B4]|uniref:ATP-binding protein n=1 Tax=Prevotella sp. P6B4 TaxID=1410614 RepID=UPI00048FBDB0|nr:ATP-binding protein [Prevotella sp. P6B4]